MPLHLRPVRCSANRNVSIGTAINRGLRRSKSAGFQDRVRGPPPSETDNISVTRSINHGSERDTGENLSRERTKKQLSTASSMKIRKGKKIVKVGTERPPRRSRAARFYDPNSSFGKKSVVYQKKLAAGEIYPDTKQEKGLKRTSAPKHAQVPVEDGLRETSRKDNRTEYGRNATSRDYGSLETDRKFSLKTKPTRTVASRIPLSIPYTTPASEFLYGTSVVEAALRSQQVPRRKLYKLYIYAGENRDKLDRDAGLERLARKNGVEVVRAGADWLRLMDKMSGGRPHNGYILEASPLPKLPLLSLGGLVSTETRITGFNVELDHQSREEAAINGTETFIPQRPGASKRKPFVLLLDSIEDPGNLGSIIRTASFLGVTAVAISTRNSASFTPVVLKASAGASETVKIFSINKPAGFIASSKLAGWKIYAAVAPSRDSSSHTVNIATTDLDDPLSEDPCILMLGNEGEGLRRSLRSKADVEVSIQGSSQAHTVDSLNVSVATGILCDAFLRRRRVKTKQEQSIQNTSTEHESTASGGELF